MNKYNKRPRGLTGTERKKTHKFSKVVRRFVLFKGMTTRFFEKM